MTSGTDLVAARSLRQSMRQQWWRHPAVSLIAAAATGGVLALGVAFSVAPRRHAPRPPTEPMAISLADLPNDPLVPILDRAALPLVGLAISMHGSAPTIVARYRGVAGCQLELRSYQAGIVVQPLAGTNRHRWKVRDVEYELVGHGMAAERFELIADAAERQTRQRPDSKIIDQKLRRARRITMPCES